MINDVIEQISDKLKDDKLERVIVYHQDVWHENGYRICEKCKNPVPKRKLLVYMGFPYHINCSPENKYTTRIRKLFSE